MLPEVVIINGKKFFPLQRFKDPLSAFLTGKNHRACPLKGIPLFQMMKDRLKAHYGNLEAEAAKTLDAAGETSEVTGAKKSKSKTAIFKSRTHRLKAAAKMLPQYDYVDMSVGIVTWNLLVVIRNGGGANVLMEVTVENFQPLFTIVQAQLSDPDTIRDIANLPKKPRARPVSDEHAVVTSPSGRKEYWVNGKGWMQCTKEEASSSASSARTIRRLLAPCVRGRKRKSPADVLGADGDDASSCQSRAASDSE